MIHPEPFQRQHRPFAIGLKPLPRSEWLEPEPRLAWYLDQKECLFSTRLKDVWADRSDTMEAQEECLATIVSQLLQQEPDRFRRTNDGVAIAGVGELKRCDQPALLFASKLVADDLVLMRKSEDGWRLVAASLCFPSSWRLADKVDKPMGEIHAPVPGFAGRMTTLVERIFDNLAVAEPVIRFNWSIYDDGELHHSETHESRSWDFGQHLRPEEAFVRTERQTLLKLPLSGDILFTIKISVCSLAEVGNHPQREEIANGLLEQMPNMKPEEHDYKSLTGHLEALRQIIEPLRLGR